MIIPLSPVAATPVAYSGGTPSTARSGFGDALNAKLAELQTMMPTTSHHHHDGQHGNGINQDAGNNPLTSGLGIGAGSITG